MPSAAPRQSRSLRLAAACLTAVAALALTACNDGSGAGVRISDDSTNSLETGSPGTGPSGSAPPKASGQAGASRGSDGAAPDDERRHAGGGRGASGRLGASDARRETGRTQPGDGAEPGSGRPGSDGRGSGRGTGAGERRAGGGQEPGQASGGDDGRQESSLGGAFAREDAAGRTGPVCTTANTVLRIKAIERPVRDLVLTATNTSRTACDAATGPRVTLGTDRPALDRAENSSSQSVTTIPPGGTVYAGIRLSGTDTGTNTGRGSGRYVMSELRVDVTETDGKRDADRPVILKAPGGTAHADAHAQVTYWLDSMADALTW
ncbi:DUF4232 domain-containing protein [Streptomyces sp. NPDC001922]|uniref:DUF4232 domain-containing protein n=1 Tax=Streptomyces sp. NPDC001922 TaxID=3364624 RepID=UPI00368F0879